MLAAIMRVVPEYRLEMTNDLVLIQVKYTIQVLQLLGS